MTKKIHLHDAKKGQHLVLTNTKDIWLEKSPKSDSLDFGDRVPGLTEIELLSDPALVSNAIYRAQVMLRGKPTWLRIVSQHVTVK